MIAARRGGGARMAVPLLAAAIVAGSLMLWIGIPAAWLWLVSQVSDEYPTIYALALLGCPLTMAAFGVLLGRINALYVHLSGEAQTTRRSAWLGSLSGERRAVRPRTLLDMSMTVSVVIALTVMAIWFFLFATNPGPTVQ